MTAEAFEVNFDGIVGPTHNYAGLAPGNLASVGHAKWRSNPREAALQGLAKMRLLAELGVPQAVLPPQERPHVDLLRRAGFRGDDAAVIERAGRDAPWLLAAACSASSMWAANAATVSPSADTADSRVHVTPANLVTCLHRAVEAEQTHAVLRAVFRDESAFAVHNPLPASAQLGDEGAANHTRLCPAYGEPGVEWFVYGRRGLDGDAATPTSHPTRQPARHPARQSREASLAVVRLHRLDPGRVVFTQQHPAAIDAGVFHNDVIAVANRNVLLYHEHAFADADPVIDQLKNLYGSACGGDLVCLKVGEEELSVRDAVATYLFNSQLVTRPDGRVCLICPGECERHAGAKGVVDRLAGPGGPIAEARFVDLRQSMMNGGGPACLRLRVVLTGDEIGRMHQGVRWTPALDGRLTAWVERHYRDRLCAEDLADPKLLDESRAALDELTGILDLPGLYPFQRG